LRVAWARIIDISSAGAYSIPSIYYSIGDLDIHHLNGAAHAVSLICIHFASLSFLYLPRGNCRGAYLLPGFREAGELVSVHVGTLGGSICGLVVSAKVIILKCLRDLRLDLGACKALSLKQHSENDRGCRNMCAIAHFLVRHRTRVAGIRNAVRTVPFASELELRNRCCTKSRYAGAATLNFARGMTTFWHNAERHRSPHDTMR
jgi:hypothetical protein